VSFSQVQVEQSNGIQFIRFWSADLTTEVIDAARPEMLLLTEPYDQRVVLDLAGVRFLSSSALGLIIQVALRIMKHRGRFVLAAPNPDVYQILTGPPRMMRDFPVFNDRAAAVLSLN